MRRVSLALVIALASACGDPQPDVAAPPSPAPAAVEPTVLPVDTALDAEPPARPPPVDARTLLSELAEPATRDGADERLEALPEGVRIDVLREGLTLPDELAYQAALRMEHHWLDADESRRYVELLLPHLFDEADEVDVDELRSALGSSEIGAVLQEMREHAEIAGERSLLGALHRQLRAEHLPALVEVALSPDPLLADQALEEVAIAALYTNAHREDVARLFAGRVDGPDATGAIPYDLVLALRAILVDERLSDVRRTMFLAWALRWLRDVEPSGPDDVAVLRDLVERTRGASGIGDWEQQQIQIYAIVELTGLDSSQLDDLEVTGSEAQTALALARRARRTDEDGRVLREMAARDPLAMALALELDPFMAPVAFVESLRQRSADEAVDWVDDVLRQRFLLRLSWSQLPSLGIRPTIGDGIEPRAVLYAASRVREVRGSHAVRAYLATLQADGPIEGWEATDLLPRIEGPELLETLRAALAEGTDLARSKAAELLVTLRDRKSEQALLEAAENGTLPGHRVRRLAAWASPAGRQRIVTLLPRLSRREALETRAVLGGVPAWIANEWVFARMGDLRPGREEPAPEVARALETLEGGDAVGALLGFLDATPHVEIDGIGLIDDPRVVEHLRRWAERREDGRTHWAIGELSIAGDPDGLRQMTEAVHTGRYRWVDNASGEALFVGGRGTLAFWVQEAESNCCRAVVVKNVFEDFVGIDVTDEMQFQAGHGVTLGEWLRWRLGEPRWLTPAAGECRLGAPQDVRALRRSELLDGYAPAIR